MHSILTVSQYSLVAVSILSSIIFVGILLFYRFVFPKKTINLFVLLLLITILPLISILRPGSYQSGDLALHVKYAMPFYDNIIQGNIIPQWSSTDCSNYGCPEYMFIFFLPYYLISLFHFLGFSFINSIKVLLILTYFASGIGMYLWIKDEFGKKAGFVSAIFYLFAPYHLIDMHFRVSIGEDVSYALLPFAFLLMKKQIQSNKIIYFVLCSLVLALLIISHQVTALFSFPFIFFYGLLLLLKTTKKIYPLLRLLGAGIFSVLLTMFYWLPLFSEGKYIEYTKNTIIDFMPITTYLYAPVRLGFLFQGHKGELYTIVGYIQWIILLSALVLLVRKKIKGYEQMLMIYFFCIFIFLFIIMQSFSQIFWNTFPFLKNIEFSYRLMLEISFAIAVIAGIIAKNIRSKKLLLLLCIITIFSTILNWGNRQNMPYVTDSVLRTQSVFNEKPGFTEVTTPVWVNNYSSWIGKPIKHPLEVITGNAIITPLSRSVTFHSYHVKVLNTAVLKENTYYFPGWKLVVNNKEYPINYQYKHYKGIITFTLPKGIYTINLIYSLTPLSLIAQSISLITLCLLIILFFIFSFFKKSNVSKKITRGGKKDIT